MHIRRIWLKNVPDLATLVWTLVRKESSCLLSFYSNLRLVLSTSKTYGTINQLF